MSIINGDDDRLCPEDARDVIKAIEDVEREEAAEQERRNAAEQQSN
ncbi:hypothetical protein ACFL2H_13895 [Planctomycetota bacterium]